MNDIVKRLNDVKISAEDTIPWLIRGEPSPMSVSYTHLDVYKRQVGNFLEHGHQLGQIEKP